MIIEFCGRQDIQGDRDNNAPLSCGEMTVMLCTHAQFSGQAEAVILRPCH